MSEIEEYTLTARQQQAEERLSMLFSVEITLLAKEIDIANIHINEEMTKSIGAGISELKKRRGHVTAQQSYVNSLAAGTRLLLCLWIMDMELTDKLR